MFVSAFSVASLVTPDTAEARRGWRRPYVSYYYGPPRARYYYGSPYRSYYRGWYGPRYYRPYDIRLPLSGLLLPAGWRIGFDSASKRGIAATTHGAVAMMALFDDADVGDGSVSASYFFSWQWFAVSQCASWHTCCILNDQQAVRPGRRAAIHPRYVYSDAVDASRGEFDVQARFVGAHVRCCARCGRTGHEQ